MARSPHLPNHLITPSLPNFGVAILSWTGSRPGLASPSRAAKVAFHGAAVPTELTKERCSSDFSACGYEGFQYVVVSSAMYGRYFAEADRYPAQVSFYSRLFTEGRLLHEFKASNTRG